MKETGRKLRQQRPTLEHYQPVKEACEMSRCGHYRDSARENNAEKPSNSWKSISQLAARIVVKAVGQ